MHDPDCNLADCWVAQACASAAVAAIGVYLEQGAKKHNGLNLEKQLQDPLHHKDGFSTSQEKLCRGQAFCNERY